MRGRPLPFQKWEASLARRLAEGLRTPVPGVLNAIIPPPVIGGDLVNQRWYHYMEANAGLIPLLPETEYGDACITRMDTHRELHTMDWYDTVSALWADKDITLVRGTDRSLVPEQMLAAAGAPESICDVLAKPRHAYDELEALYDKIIAARRETVILCLGPAAKPLVHLLVQAGLSAYDLGHFGVWFKDGIPKQWEECRA